MLTLVLTLGDGEGEPVRLDSQEWRHRRPANVLPMGSQPALARD